MDMSVVPACGAEAESYRSNYVQSEYPEGFCYVGPNKHVAPAQEAKKYWRFANFQVRQDDIFITSFPRAGSTWITEIIWLLKNDLDFKTAKEKQYFNRILSLMDYATEVKDEEFGIAKSPRIIKVHLPYEMLPTGCATQKPKVVFITRNAKDVCVSYFHLQKNIMGYVGTFDAFAEAFLNGNVTRGPYWNLVNSFHPVRNEENIFIASYEEMLKDLPAAITQLAKFLNVELTTDGLAQLVAHSQFSSMKTNPAINLEAARPIMEAKFQKQLEDGFFIRKGKSGSWKEEMSEELSKKFDIWIEKNELKY